MNKFIAAIALCSLGLGHASLAATSDKAKFYNFDVLDIDGGGKKPAVTVFDTSPRPNFPRLLKLKKSLRPAMQATGEDRALK